MTRLAANSRNGGITAIPTVALTARAMAGDKEAALAAGFDGYISKPIDTQTFSHTVARILASAA